VKRGGPKKKKREGKNSPGLANSPRGCTAHSVFSDKGGTGEEKKRPCWKVGRGRLWGSGGDGTNAKWAARENRKEKGGAKKKKSAEDRVKKIKIKTTQKQPKKIKKRRKKKKIKKIIHRGRKKKGENERTENAHQIGSISAKRPAEGVHLGINPPSHFHRRKGGEKIGTEKKAGPGETSPKKLAAASITIKKKPTKQTNKVFFKWGKKLPPKWSQRGMPKASENQGRKMEKIVKKREKRTKERYRNKRETNAGKKIVKT